MHTSTVLEWQEIYGVLTSPSWLFRSGIHVHSRNAGFVRLVLSCRAYQIRRRVSPALHVPGLCCWSLACCLA